MLEITDAIGIIAFADIVLGNIVLIVLVLDIFLNCINLILKTIFLL